MSQIGILVMQIFGYNSNTSFKDSLSSLPLSHSFSETPWNTGSEVGGNSKFQILKALLPIDLESKIFYSLK